MPVGICVFMLRKAKSYALISASMRKSPSENELLAYVDSLAKISFKNDSDSDTVLEYLKTARDSIKKAHESGSSGIAVCSANLLMLCHR